MANAIREKIEAAKAVRPVYVYEIPASLGDEVKTIGLVQLTAHEEMMCAKRSNGDTFKMAYEQLKEALVEVNGETVKIADGSADAAFGKMSPPVRQLLMTAHAKLHAPPEEAVEDFLASRQVRVG